MHQSSFAVGAAWAAGIVVRTNPVQQITARGWVPRRKSQLDPARPTEFFGKQHTALIRLDSVRPGDVLLSRNDEPESTLFAKLSGGRWSHAALWIPVQASERSKDANSWINLQLVEADEFGIGATPLRQVTLSDPTKSVSMEVALLPGYARLRDRQSLEDMRMHRRRLAVDLKARTGFDCRSSIAQVEQDIAAIEAGLGTLSGPVAG
jgi:hypothetical protein